jgi:hypothetical protein
MRFLSFPTGTPTESFSAVLRAGPISNTRYTPGELENIYLESAYGEPVAEGWTVTNCEQIWRQAIQENLDGHSGVLVTHPLDQNTAAH